MSTHIYIVVVCEDLLYILWTAATSGILGVGSLNHEQSYTYTALHLHLIQHLTCWHRPL